MSRPQKSYPVIFKRHHRLILLGLCRQSAVRHFNPPYFLKEWLIFKRFAVGDKSLSKNRKTGTNVGPHFNQYNGYQLSLDIISGGETDKANETEIVSNCCAFSVKREEKTNKGQFS